MNTSEREEWARRRRDTSRALDGYIIGAPWAPNRKLSNYAAVAEVAQVRLECKALYATVGNLLRAATIDAGDLARQKDETTRQYDRRVGREEMDRLGPVFRISDIRQYRLAVKLLFESIDEDVIPRMGPSEHDDLACEFEDGLYNGHGSNSKLPEDLRSYELPKDSLLYVFPLRYRDAWVEARRIWVHSVEQTPIDDAAWAQEEKFRAECAEREAAFSAKCKALGIISE
jgi:hypothetical protein